MRRTSYRLLGLLPDAVIAWPAAVYIRVQRNRYRPEAQPLTANQRAAMDAFFSPETLEAARLLVLRGKRVTSPRLYPLLRWAGMKALPDKSFVSAITFHDCVVAHREFTDGLLFHELVHVEQFRQLGVGGFAELYARGFLEHGG